MADLSELLDNHLVRLDLTYEPRLSDDGRARFDWWGAGHDTEEEGYYIRIAPLADKPDLDAYDWPDANNHDFTPLRQRMEDIPLLVEWFVEIFRKKMGKNVAKISQRTMKRLQQYPWPGNVRELENCIERAVLLCEEGVIHSYHLPPTLQTGKESDTVPSLALEDAVASLEKEMIIDALKNTAGNVTMATQILQTTVRKFAYKAQKYGVDYRQYR